MNQRLKILICDTKHLFHSSVDKLCHFTDLHRFSLFTSIDFFFWETCIHGKITFSEVSGPIQEEGPEGD